WKETITYVYGSSGIMGGPSTPGEPMSEYPPYGLDTAV
ncbi:hypothetical protein Tco_0507387, partial [Tanacetum coccineum]